MNTNEYSSYDSEEQDDQVDPTYLGRVLSQNMPKSGQFWLPDRNQKNAEQPQEDDDVLLKPKLRSKKEQINTMNNPSTVSSKSEASKMTRRPLTAAYTFKLPTPQIKRKRHDPVSLFQQTSQSWRKDKFLTSRGNNKQGRKLELDKRNRNNRMQGTIEF